MVLDRKASDESKSKDCAHHRHHRAGWFVPCGIASRERVRRAWSCSANEQSRALAHRTFAARRKRVRQASLLALRRSFRWNHLAAHLFESAAGGNLSSRWAEPPAFELRNSGIDLR